MECGYESAWVPSNLDRYNRFMTALMHGEDWNHAVKHFAVYWLKLHGEDEQLCSPVFENCGEHQHAEEYLLKHLRLLLSAVNKHGIHSLQILQSTSPCFRCCERYHRELKDLSIRWSIKVTIAFSSFYKIIRPSCEKSFHMHGGFVSKHESDHNKRGLLKLVRAGLNIRTTYYEDWVDLRSALQLPGCYPTETYSHSARKREDDVLQEDLKEILEALSTNSSPA